MRPAPDPREMQMDMLEAASFLVRDGSVKSVTRRFASDILDRDAVKVLVDCANAFLKESYDPRWKHLPAEQRDLIAEVLDRTLVVMEDEGLELADAMKEATEAVEQEQGELEDQFDDDLDEDDALPEFIYSDHCGTVVREGRTYEVAIWTFVPSHPDDPPIRWSAEIRRPDHATLNWTSAFADEAEAHAAVLAELELRALPPV